MGIDYNIIYEMITQNETNSWLKIAIAIAVSIISSGGLSACLQSKLQKRTEKRKLLEDENDVKKKMLLGLAHDKLVYLALKYIERDYITKEEHENIYKFLYTPYKELGGNGTVDRLMDDVGKLPIKTFCFLRSDQALKSGGSK